VTVTLERLDDAVSVDARAIHRDGGAQYVLALEGGRSVRRAVELGPACSGRVVVTKGLAGGEKVLLR
jgi:hypothetical protein